MMPRPAQEYGSLVMKSNRFWIILLSGILIVSAICVAVFTRNLPSAEWAFIYQDGILIDSIDLASLSEPELLTVEHGSGVNQIIAEPGRIRVSGANCPDGFCIRQGWVSGGLVPIVCLPHRLVISFDNAFSLDFDAITG